MKKRFWNLKRTTNNSAELTIYSPIDDEESWWYDSVTPKSLLRDLDALGDVSEITVRINSGGGSAFAGLTIYEILKSHKATIITRVDGLAASAASIIAMAGDKIIMGTGAMLMIHNPWTIAIGESKDLRHTADVLDKVSQSLISVYSDRTGLDAKEIKKMLDKETWLTADEAVEKGFADEVDRKYQVSASIRDGFAYFNGQKFDLKAFASVPNLPVLDNETTEDETEDAENGPEMDENDQNVSESEEEDVKNLDELKAKYPDLYQAAVQDGIEQERNRMKAIDDLGLSGYKDLIQKAKYETGASAEQLAMEVLKAQQQQRRNYLNAVQQDVEESGVDDVPTDDPTPPSEEEDTQTKAQAIANYINKLRGGNK
ncbi:head maturation protease, ClpP-related [Thermaerobacillus caldiproteolyticus]|uniref:head maturation protease, ClpP-related n=1 Tax=Thermaerobacillus caldiproteolyticus TaxID=247480 RepID=UPI00188DB3EA|nr:head maturation protease, ClpP-related [Anoxybacillus caldiproteolyticus]QPA33424.1 Clp protease ClpP [Anoxybacillus caldiproteolyticus]